MDRRILEIEPSTILDSQNPTDCINLKTTICVAVERIRRRIADIHVLHKQLTNPSPIRRVLVHPQRCRCNRTRRIIGTSDRDRHVRRVHQTTRVHHRVRKDIRQRIRRQSQRLNTCIRLVDHIRVRTIRLDGKGAVQARHPCANLSCRIAGYSCCHAINRLGFTIGHRIRIRVIVENVSYCVGTGGAVGGSPRFHGRANVRIGNGIIVSSTDRYGNLRRTRQSTRIRHGISEHIRERLTADPQLLNRWIRFIDHVGV